MTVFLFDSTARSFALCGLLALPTTISPASEDRAQLTHWPGG